MDILDRLLAHDAWTTRQRTQVMYLMERVGLKEHIEGDLLGWEASSFGWD